MERLTNIVSSIIANLALLHRGKPQARRLAIPMEHRKATRYDRPGFGMLPKVIDQMAVLGLIIKHPAVAKERRTGIEATGWLLEALAAPALPLADIGRASGEEVIKLAARAGRDRRGRKLPSIPVDYKDCRTADRLREEMEEINTFLAKQKIELDGEPQAAVRLARYYLLRKPSDPHEFMLHGRLYGGFWQSLPKARRGGLTINGEPIADLDFASMFPRLCYARVGAIPPEGDLYAIPGLEGHRAAVKAGLSALLSSGSEMARLPSDVKAALPAGWTAKRLRDAVAVKHPALMPLFGKDIGLDLMHYESCIMVAVLLRLASLGIPGLPMHDGLMVPRSFATRAKRAMEFLVVQMTGTQIVSVVKATN
ncbi:MAG: hypothetical protein KKB66_16050 [Alphaproteobacteria bacterium]|nr:hypothetical protein [Alphaproteobacteria bacterium]MBU0804312.1 hypothetical protein [Alphaproteobacteria bacterium]MBU0871143.1 hypothetical protein [Alphaproteobacteria bacterium]MBU1400898.1 hypothetical protein [Alphaproteobacteria bacterium]MBU1592685.1 hypothetical protein [Alphaproteobacteria bacterium]